MNFLEMVKTFIDETGRYDYAPGWEDGDWTAPKAKRMILDGLQYIQDRLSYPNPRQSAMLALVDGQYTLDPHQLRYILGVEVSDGSERTCLEQKSWEELRCMYNKPFGDVDRGRPRYWCRNIPRQNALVPIKNPNFTNGLDHWTVYGGEPSASGGLLRLESNRDRPRDIIYQILASVQPADSTFTIEVLSLSGAAGEQLSLFFGLTDGGELPATLVHSYGGVGVGVTEITVPAEWDIVEISYQATDEDGNNVDSTCTIESAGVGIADLTNPEFTEGDDGLDGWSVSNNSAPTVVDGVLTMHAWADLDIEQQVVIQTLEASYPTTQTFTVNVAQLPEDGILLVLVASGLVEDGDLQIVQVTTEGETVITPTVENWQHIGFIYQGLYNTAALIDSVTMNVSESNLDPVAEGLILLMPPADKSFTAYVNGAFWADEPVGDNDETLLMSQEPRLCLDAAKGMNEGARHRNKEGSNFFLESVDERIKLIIARRQREKSAGPAHTAVLKG